LKDFKLPEDFKLPFGGDDSSADKEVEAGFYKFRLTFIEPRHAHMVSIGINQNLRCFKRTDQSVRALQYSYINIFAAGTLNRLSLKPLVE